jgi:hypothetical protein
MLEAALEYACRGIPVFPCVPRDKGPVIKKCPVSRRLKLSGEALARHALTCSRDGHGYHDATTDPQKIREWWGKWPDANIGVPTGKLSGWLVVDRDHPAALDALEEEHGALPATRAHRTGSGGMHYLYRYPEGPEIRNSAGRLAEHLDIRGEGGYVLAPPSVTDGPYEVMEDLPLAECPGWLAEALTAPKKASPRTGGSTTPRAHLVALDGPFLKGQRHDGFLSWLGRQHNRESTLEEFTALALKGNEELCVPPIGSPGDDDPLSDVISLAEWVHARPLCRPQGKRAPEEVRQLLLVFEHKIEAMTWSGHASNRLSLLKSYILEALKHGVVHEDGVALSISESQTALHNGISPRSVRRGKAALAEMGVIATDNGGRTHTESGTIVLLVDLSDLRDNLTTPRSVPPHNESGCVVEEQGHASVEGGDTSGRLAQWSAVRGRHGKPLYDGAERVGFLPRFGKRGEEGVDKLEEAGGRLMPEGLAGAMGIKKVRNMFRYGGWLWKLMDAGVVEQDAEGYLQHTADWLGAWDSRRILDEEEIDRERDRKRYKDASEARAHWVAERAEELHQKRLRRTRIECCDGVDPETGEIVSERREVPMDLETGEKDVGERSEFPAERTDQGDACGGAGEPQRGAEKDQGDLSGLVRGLRMWLAWDPQDHPDRKPPGDRRGQRSWLESSLWAYDLLPPGKRYTSEEVAEALRELERAGRKAAA